MVITIAPPHTFAVGDADAEVRVKWVHVPDPFGARETKDVAIISHSPHDLQRLDGSSLLAVAGNRPRTEIVLVNHREHPQTILLVHQLVVRRLLKRRKIV
jgi:hypothetical protein